MPLFLAPCIGGASPFASVALVPLGTGVAFDSDGLLDGCDGSTERAGGAGVLSFEMDSFDRDAFRAGSLMG